ncbi:MarR family winged helix-turn-helix transcriptional regulator [Paenibacillus filicis]|uniref:MarR family winged helix-turn-helix transcriptional regulator n=1 Tax=Paenibacillus gyeongsangnamensis TaxID=3388067 RepID=A0ABT4QFQ0_9BACL|nr:MarR family winged helix-turn-helix transcriptional regulator [Paenibacillus filicis]MCZ8515693.1 MarR family winged helix-turn-helix transcriptional regulator [Paenibacillus filicis]
MSNRNDDSTWEWDKGPIGRLVKVSHITLRREIEELLKPTGLTHTQWSALGIIRHFPGITSSEMERILMIERPSVTSLINGLAARRLAVRRDHPNDARYKQIFLTEEGTRLADQTGHFTSIVEDRVRNGLTQEEFETLKALLIKMVGLFGKS